MRSGISWLRATVTVEGERIAAIKQANVDASVPAGDEVTDCTGLMPMPGFTDRREGLLFA
jgi:imidazolonepropionase-like amidohydrolase